MKNQPLRVVGTSVTLHEELRQRAQKDLGFPISFEIFDGPTCQQRGVTQPQSYDIYDQWFHSIDLLWTAGSIEPIDTERITHWPDASPLTLTGSPVEGARKAGGTCPANVLFVQDNNTLASKTTNRICMLPTTFNVDSFAYGRDAAPGKKAETIESWSWLLDDRWHSRCILSQDMASSVVELALAATSAGMMRIADVGNLTIEEIDALFELLMRLKKKGHFSRSWAMHEESVRLFTMPSDPIGSLWSPAYYEIRGLGRDLQYAVPREGYRGWHSGLSLSSAIPNQMRYKAYAYLNWWLSGVPGAIMARQGYYMSVIEPVRDTLSAVEWDFWYGGKPAETDLASLHGEIAIRAGDIRSGGSYKDRVGSIAVWSTIMDEHNYIVRHWREFIRN
ncbi:MAG: extracellular solute-binding protein [Aestuariivirga sp.]